MPCTSEVKVIDGGHNEEGKSRLTTAAEEAVQAAERGDLTAAVEAFERAIELDGANSALHYMVAQCATDLGKDDRALEAARAAVELAPDDAEYHLTLGRVLYNCKELEEAVCSFKKANELDPTSAPAEKDLAQTLEMLDELLYARREVITTHGSLRIRQTAQEDAGPSTSIWEAGAVLAYYVVTREAESGHGTLPNGVSIRGKSVLELGGGTGVVGLTAAAYGAHVCITDKEDLAVSLALRNIEGNLEILKFLEGSARAEHLDWFSPREDICLQPWDAVIGSDLVYNVGQINQLRTLIKALFLPAHPSRVLLLAHKSRHDDVDTNMMQMFEEEGLKVKEIPMAEHHPAFCSPSVHIYTILKAKT
jgi:predicted nicotinamide N-methyase